MRRTVLLAPLILGLAGAGVGISLGMWFCEVPENRIHLDRGVKHASAGGILGFFIGIGLTGVCANSPRLTRPAGLLVFVLLGGAMTAPIGWLAGTIQATEDFRRVDGTEWEDKLAQMQRTTRTWLFLGAAVGCTMGLALGRTQILLDNRRQRVVGEA